MKKLSLLLLITLSGCTLSNQGVFPQPVWYWSAKGKYQRECNKEEKTRIKAYQESLKTNITQITNEKIPN